MEFLIIALLVSRFLVRNYWQDALHAWRGEDSPSYRREQERFKARQARGEGPDPHRAAKRYFANAWNDAFETAEENRARRRAKRLKDRHDRWADEDGELVEAGDEAPAGAEAEVLEPAPVPEPAFPHDEENPEPAFAPDPDPVPAPDPEPVVAEDDTAYRVVEPEPDTNPTGGKVIAFPVMNTTKEENMSAEIVGLRAGITWTAESAQRATEAANEVELAIAGLEAGGTTGSAIVDLRGAQEFHSMTAEKYKTANAELTRQLQVAEAYEANKGAGTKQFVTQA